MIEERETSTTERESPEQGGASEVKAEAPRTGAEGPEISAAPETAGADEAGNPAAETPERLTALLEDARAKADENWDQLLRARAEIENLKRRQAIELEKAHKFALDGFVRELLQVRDSLELGHNAALDQGTNVAKLREGTELTLKLLTDGMSKFGVEQVDPEGAPFDPDFHQAMTTQPRDDLPPNTVVSVVQKGYLLNGRLVRPAMVIVSATPTS